MSSVYLKIRNLVGFASYRYTPKRRDFDDVFYFKYISRS